MDEVDVVGIATDYCVKATAADAVAAGFTTRVLLDLTAGVAAESTAEAVEDMRAAGVDVLVATIKRRGTSRVRSPTVVAVRSRGDRVSRWAARTHALPGVVVAHHAR